MSSLPADGNEARKVIVRINDSLAGQATVALIRSEHKIHDEVKHAVENAALIGSGVETPDEFKLAVENSGNALVVSLKPAIIGNLLVIYEHRSRPIFIAHLEKSARFPDC